MRIQMDTLRDILRLVIENESEDLTSYDFDGGEISYETIAFHQFLLLPADL